MALWGMVIDLDKCTGCGACAAVCKMENNIPCGPPEEARKGRTLHWVRMLNTTEGEYPRVKADSVPVPCFHCDRPPCTRVCPVHATYRADDGIVAQIYPRCIGCRYCMAACPYTAKVFNWFEPRWDDTMPESRNPDVSVRPKGVVEKCTFCSHRLQEGRERAAVEGRPFTEADYQPACAEACPAGAITFGDLDDGDSAVRNSTRSNRTRRYLEDLGTEPKIYYLAAGDRHV